MNTNREKRLSNSTIAIWVVVLVLFITLLGGIRPPVSLAAPPPGVSPSSPPTGTFNVQIQALKCRKARAVTSPAAQPPAVLRCSSQMVPFTWPTGARSYGPILGWRPVQRGQCPR